MKFDIWQGVGLLITMFASKMILGPHSPSVPKVVSDEVAEKTS
jgi:hypothetical protein